MTSDRLAIAGSCPAAVVLVLALVASEGLAQEFRATLTGRVTDEQGAVIPGADIIVTNIDTNVSVESVSNENGIYTISQLQPGSYRLTATIQGFKTFVREGIVLRTAETGTVNVRLSVGVLEETVTVVAALSAAESNQSTLAQMMENKRVSELPLNGRQVYMLLQLTAGTFFTQTTFGSTGFSGTRAWDTNGNISIHGSRTGNNEFLIDGAPNAATGGWQYAPPVDAIQEFKVQTASVDASQGRTSGGVVNMTLKSGSNAFHGSTFTFYRGNALDANTTQNNRNGIPKSGHRFVDGGGIVSGPIRRDRTFFMGGYQGFNEDIPFPRTSTVSTDVQRAGDFSQTFNSAGQLVVIYDPLTTRPDPSRPGRFIRDPFPGNTIPPERINPVAAALLGFIPRANVGGEPFTAANNLAVSPNLGLYRYNSYISRVDHNFSDRHRLFVTSTANWGVEFRNQNGFPIPSLRGNWPKHRNHYMETIDDVYTVSSDTLLNFRVSFDRFNDYNPITYAALNGDLPIRTPFQVVPAQYPYITIDGGLRREPRETAADQRPRHQRGAAGGAREGDRAARRQCLVLVDARAESVCRTGARHGPQQRHDRAQSAPAAVPAVPGDHDGPRQRRCDAVRRDGARCDEAAVAGPHGGRQLHVVETVRAGCDRRGDDGAHDQRGLHEQRIRREAVALDLGRRPDAPIRRDGALRSAVRTRQALFKQRHGCGGDAGWRLAGQRDRGVSVRNANGDPQCRPARSERQASEVTAVARALVRQQHGLEPRPDGTYAWAVIPPNDFRTLNVRFPDIRDPWEPQWAFSLFKNTRLGNVMTQLRLEAFNAFNTPIYGAPDVGVTSARFGKITANQINFPRHIQLGLRVVF